MRREHLASIAIAATLAACSSTSYYRVNTASGKRTRTSSCERALAPTERCVTETQDATIYVLAIPVVLIALVGVMVAVTGPHGAE